MKSKMLQGLIDLKECGSFLPLEVEGFTVTVKS